MRQSRESGMSAVDSPITMEAVMSVVISTTAAAGMTVGNTEHPLDCADCAADACPDDATDCAAHGTPNAITLIGALPGAAHDALGMARLRQRQQREHESDGCEQQADGRTGRQRGDMGFVHVHSRVCEVLGGMRRCRVNTINVRRGGMVAALDRKSVV